MRTSRRMLKQVRRALFAAFLFSGCINILMLATPLYILQIFETVVPLGSLDTLVLLSVMVAAALLTSAALETARDTILLRSAYWLDHELGHYILENGVRLATPGPEMRQDAAALERFRGFLASPAIVPLFDAPWTPVFLLALFALNPLIGMVGSVCAALLIVSSLLLSAATARAEGERGKSSERSQQWWQTITGNAQYAGALGLARGAADSWEVSNRAQVSAGYSIGKRTAFLRALSRFVRISAQVALYGCGALLVIRGEIGPGALVAAAILMARALSPLEGLVGSIRGIQAAVAGYRRLASLPPDAVTPQLAASGGPIAGRIEVRDVTYYHAGRKAPALRSVSLVVEPGQCIGIVGANGSGKSTLAALLAGAILPSHGAADLDGIPIAKWQRVGSAPPIGYLPDEPILIEGTVHENIARFGEAPLMAVAEAAIRAGVLETLKALPLGFDTPVGPQGQALALRERRAVAFARALFGQPRIVIADEPELGLDGAALRRLTATLEELKAGGTTLVLATQDPRLLDLCTGIVVINAGSIKAAGPAADVKNRITAERRSQVPAVEQPAYH
jgi:ATP-binding cassette, subfamily C, type I secretion system permease/ATPase